jgi:plasmid stabilization system protein ParE
MGSLKEKDIASNQRDGRALPFRIVSARKHLIVYEVIDQMPVILTLLHQRRDIESMMRDFTPSCQTVA